MRLRVCMFLLLAFAGGCYRMAAQEVVTDTLGRAAYGEAVEDRLLDGTPQMDDTRSYGGFLIDMSLFKPTNVPMPSELPGKILLPPTTPDYSRLFALPSSATYTQGSFYGFSTWGWPMGTSIPTHLQMGQFKLNNGWSLNTYGQYNAQGYRVMNPSALPWERNNFHGAFELKSSNGSFGIRVEVKQGRQSPW